MTYVRMASRRGRSNRRRVWYVTAAHGMYHRSPSATSWVPTASTHLKRVGVPETACGVLALNWQVFWLDDPERTPGVCQECLDAVRTDDDDEAMSQGSG